MTLTESQALLPAGSVLTLYTDGLIEHRGRDIDVGLDLLTEQLTRLSGPLVEAPGALVSTLVPTEPDDDIAVLLARVTDHAALTDEAVLVVPPHDIAVQRTRRNVGKILRRWRIPPRRADDILLLVSELVTNALVHGRPSVRLRLRNGPARVIVEVHDGATFLPRKLRPTPDDEHGRGLQLVALLADRWGTRPTADGKCVWCVVGTG
jgi:anti-sigma regulatory factor (Ser/Thr protein kinase)